MNENIHVFTLPGSMYNMIHGTRPATFFIIPMLDKHPDEFPRYRDCFLSDTTHPEYNDLIHVYTRVGSLNQGDGYGEEDLCKDENYVAFFDDEEDKTYGTYVFKVPTKWENDFKKFKEGKLKEFSSEYIKQLYKIFPKCKDKFDELFNKTN